jgi:uncharacterized protein
MSSFSSTELAPRYGRWAIIAGASEGIGACLADQLAAHGLNLVLVSRNAGLLEEVATGIRDNHGVEARTLVLDLTSDPLIGRQVAAVTAGLEVGLLIYNAGAVNRTVQFLDEPFDSWLDQVKLNCVGPLSLVYEFGPAMRARGRGGIVLIGALSCLAGATDIAVYSGVKAFQVNFAESMWSELHAHGVDVCSAVIGATYTPANARYHGNVKYDPEHFMSSEEVAREIIENIGNGPVHVVGEKNRASTGSWAADRQTAMEAIDKVMRASAELVATASTRHQ